MDGKQQRNALTAAENAVHALGAADGERAMLNATKAVELDQLGVFAALPAAMRAAVAALDETGTVPAVAWDDVRTALPAGPLRRLADACRR